MSRKGIKNRKGDLGRFFEKVVCRGDSCWIWTGATYAKGYGAFWLDGRVMGAHKASFILHVGPVPNGLLICHKCDTPPCVNPDHLFLGTAADNTNDAKQKSRFDYVNARLDKTTVLAIRSAEGSQYAIASKFGVDQATVSKIKSRKLYGYME